LVRTSLVNYVLGYIIGGISVYITYEYSKVIGFFILILGIIIYEFYQNKYGKEADVVIFGKNSEFNNEDDFISAIEKSVRIVMKEQEDK